jgi:hypothetical protein
MTKYCPKCSGEYEDRVGKCTECGEKLIETKPVKEDIPGDRQNAENDPMELVAIASYEQSQDATFNKSILASEGIDSIVTDEPINMLEWMDEEASHYSLKLMVRRADAEKALEILNSIVKDIPEDGFLPEDNLDQTGTNDPKAQI